MRKILFIPSAARGNGSGHLRRCCVWADSPLYEGYLYIEKERLAEISSGCTGNNLFSGLISSGKIVSSLSGYYDMTVLDMRNTPSELLKKCREISSFITGVDEGAERTEIDYLIDTLPNLLLPMFSANVSSVGLLGIPDRRTLPVSGGKKERYKRILVSFGGEDPAGITERFLHDACRAKLFDGLDVTVIIGPFFKNSENIKKSFGFFNIIEAPESLLRLIEDSDLVFTSFGLTAFEALYSGRHVILVNPSDYHRKLSLRSGICEAGIIKADIPKIRKLLDNPALYNKKVFGTLDAPSDITGLFLKASETEKALCPFCGKQGRIFERFPDKNYLKCQKCGVPWLQNIGLSEKLYDKSYFFEEYRKQYGKTYIEDFENIASNSVSRRRIIRKHKPGGNVLDVGCAYGPFLDIMKRGGYFCTGTDISEEAVGYVREKLGIRAIAGNFTSIDSSILLPDSADGDKHAGFDIVTMWYVIEHFGNTGEIIEKVRDILSPGGIFAFSTPNSSGISGLKNKKRFLESSPSDHYTVWSIKAARHLLSVYGFRVVKTRCTGHHPERFPKLMKKIAGKAILSVISRIFRLGDTFEIYAVKADRLDV